MFIGIFLYIVLAVVAGGVGADRQIGFWVPFILSLLLTPLIGLIVAFSSDRQPKGPGKLKASAIVAFMLISTATMAQFSTPKNVNTLIIVYDSIGQDSIYNLCRDYLIEAGHEFESIDPAIGKMKTKPQAINKHAMALYSLSFTAIKNRLYIRPYSQSNITTSFYAGGAAASTTNNETRCVKKNYGVYKAVYEHAEKAAWELMQLSPSHVEFKTD